MGLEQGIKHHKEHRKEYRGSKAVDKTCRNHGGCDWCVENRLYKYLKRSEAMDQEEEEWMEDDNEL